MTPDSTKSGKARWTSLVALAVVPILAVGALLGLTQRDDDAVSAAVVNLDQAVTVEGQYIPMGRQLAAAMIDRDGDNINWTLADAPSAAAGLRTGEYSAVVTIPETFSAAATSFSANDAASAEQATISVKVSDNAPVSDAQVAQQISRLAVDTINDTLTSTYLENIYVGFNTVGEQFTTIVDGASQLHDGASKLAEGTLASSQGAAQLSDGMGLLKQNGPKLVDGGDQLVIGIRELGSGTGQLADGADQLADGVDQFAAQTPQLVDGVGQLADGAGQLLGGVPDFANGAAAAIGGVTPIRQGLDQIIAGLDAGGGDTGGLDQLTQGAKGLAAGADGIAGGLQQVSGTLGGYSQGQFDPYAEGAIAQVVAGFQCPEGLDPATCGMLTQTFAAGVNGGFRAGAGMGAGMLTTPDASGSSLLGGAQDLATGAGQYAAGVETAVDQIGQQTEQQLGELKGGLTQLRDGAAQLETQAAPLVANAPKLAQGSTELLAGIQALDQQVGALPAGVNQLADGARQLADGVSELDAGVGELTTGAATFVDGVTQYTEGVGSAADGAAALTDGLVQLDDGAQQLADGVGTFATELAKGKDQVPSYTADAREALATVVASPIAKDTSVISSGAVPAVSLLLVAGLWLGALASFVVTRPIPRDALTSRASSAALWARTVGLPAAIVAGQGLVLGLAGGVILDVGAGKTLGLMGLLAVLGVSFVLVNHALAAWLGSIGRGISVLLLVLTVALGLSSAAGWLAPIATVSPLHNGFTLLRTWLSGGSGEVGIATVAVLMAAIAAILSAMSIASRRQLTVERFVRAV